MLNKINFLISRNRQASIIRLVISILFLISLGFPVYGQFSSGSTGADGAFSPTANTTLQLPESGVFNFTTVNIPQNVIVTFTRNSRNTPVTILATGNVIVAGQFILNGGNATGRFGGVGGPGGGNGGNGGSPIDSINGTSGDGPGGGTGSLGGTTGVGQGGGAGFLNPGANGSATGNGVFGLGGVRYGTKTLLPLIGGSGGGGGSTQLTSTTTGGAGGGGGGGILIASSGTITFPDNANSVRGIAANSGNPTFAFQVYSGGGGSGGAIRLVANAVIGSPCLQVNGYGTGSPAGSNGIIRVEAFDLSQYVPRCSTFEQTLGNPNPVTLPNTPTLKITSVGGIASPTNPIASSSTVNPDIVVPTTIQNPVQVAIQASNLAVGTVLQVRLTPESGSPTVVNSTPLAGTLSSSTATASVTLPTSGISVIRTFVTVDVAVAFAKGNTFINGEKVSKVEFSSSSNGQTEVAYILESGRRVTGLK